MGKNSKSTPKPLKTAKNGLKTKKKVNRKTVIKKLDAIFSKYIRLKNSNNGQCECYTCGKLMDWTEAQNGHFYTRGRYSTRWDESNVRCQCVGCNVFLHGNYINYTRNMVNEIGMDKLVELEVKSLRPMKIATCELQDMVDYYELKVNQLKETL